MNSAQRLDTGVTALGLDISVAQRQGLLDYLSLLMKWNRTYNLTAICQEADMVDLHLLDSLTVLPALRKSVVAGRRDAAPVRLADIGSGAGLPGLVIAMLEPGWRITSVEAVAKKAAFQRQACIELGLRNVDVIAGRVEAMPGGTFDMVVSRAFAELGKFIALAGHLPIAGGALFAMKGGLPAGELASLPPDWMASSVQPLAVPGVNAERHLIVLEKACTSSQ